MNHEERQLLQGLFDRLRDSSQQARDPEVERFIAEQIRSQPGATYYMAQAVIVQEQALQQSQGRIAELEDRVRQLEGAGQSQNSFLAGRTGGMFGRGGSSEPQRPASSVPATGPWNNRGPSMAPQQQPQQGFSQPMQGQQQPAAGGGFGGGGFLKGAIATAAGVAGGALIYDQMKGMFGGGSGAAQASTGADQAEANRYQDQGQDQEDAANEDSSSFDQGSDSGGDMDI